MATYIKAVDQIQQQMQAQLGSRMATFISLWNALRRAFVKNPYMRVLVAEGWYDVATPILGIEYTLSHMGLDASMRNNISTAQYPSGHMVYIQVTSLAKLKQDVDTMMRQALKGGGAVEAGEAGEALEPWTTSMPRSLQAAKSMTLVVPPHAAAVVPATGIGSIPSFV